MSLVLQKESMFIKQLFMYVNELSMSVNSKQGFIKSERIYFYKRFSGSLEDLNHFACFNEYFMFYGVFLNLLDILKDNRVLTNQFLSVLIERLSALANEVDLYCESVE